MNYNDVEKVSTDLEERRQRLVQLYNVLKANQLAGVNAPDTLLTLDVQEVDDLVNFMECFLSN